MDKEKTSCGIGVDSRNVLTPRERIGGNPTAGATVQSEIPRELSILALSIDELHDILEVLFSKVRPVYSDRPEKETDEKVEVTCSSSVGQSIQEQRNRVRSAVGVMRCIISGLEI